MLLTKRIKGRAIAALLGAPGDTAREWTDKARRAILGKPDQLDFYFDLADPWSYLAAQAVERLIAAYDVPLGFHFITPPASDVDVEPLLRAKHAVRDALCVAEYWDVDFAGKRDLEPMALKKAGGGLIKERPAREQLRCAIEIADALWTADTKRLNELLGQYGSESAVAVASITNANYSELRRRGHYQGAMMSWRGQWYWGVDRIHYLERELAAYRNLPVVGVLEAREESSRAPARLSPNAGTLPVDVWVSFRSPYAYLAIAQLEDALRPFDVQVRLRPIRSTVDRGIKLPDDKRMYIARDAYREAHRLGIAFGNLCEPRGVGVQNATAITHWASTRDDSGRLALAFAQSAMRGMWSEARDLADYVDLRHVVERAGLSWDEAKASLNHPSVDDAVETNAADLNLLGLWGVPSFRAGDFVAWGQDRLPILVDKLRRHFDAPPAAPAPVSPNE